MTVRFNTLDEVFLEIETRKDALDPDHTLNPHFVRATIDYTPLNDGVTQVAVQLSFRVGGETNLYEHVCEEGDVLGAGAPGGTNEAKRLIEDVTSRLDKMDIATMGGVFEG